MSSAFWQSLRHGLKRHHEAGRLGAVMAGLPPAAYRALLDCWPLWARESQLPPAGDWTVWLLLGGRGAGKTRAGAEWVKGMALGLPPFALRPVGRIALVGETVADAREVMVEGVSGVLAVHDARQRPDWSPTRRRLEWGNGTIAQLYSAEDPDSLRGPQFAAAWADELAKWRHAEATWDMLQFGLRIGARPSGAVPVGQRGEHAARLDAEGTGPVEPALRGFRHRDRPGDAASGARMRIRSMKLAGRTPARIGCAP